MPQPPEPVIALVGFGFRHVGADHPAVDDVSLEIRRGEYVGVLGAAGAGVSSLLSALDGVVPQLIRGDAWGSIAVLGRDPRAVPVPEWARDVGLVLDDPSLIATQSTVADEVAFGLENLGVPPAEMSARIAAALHAVGLAGFEARVPRTLSGGELQRLAIACALVAGPSILVLDEPSANLDPAGRRAVLAAIRGLNRDHGVTVVVTEQQPDTLAADASRVVVLEGGRVVADGPPDDILGRPAELERHRVRSSEAASLGEALGLPAPVPTSVEAVAARLVRSAAGPAGEPLDRVGDRSLEALVEVRDVSFRYPGAASRAVAGVTLSVASGEVIGIVGANGSGKTTLGRLVNGLLRPLRGAISVDGLDTARHSIRTLAAHVGSVFQDPAHQLFASTVAEELALGPRALGRTEAMIGERVREIADELELGELLGRHPLRLGRAERKRVALGAVLAMSPRVLILDEPTSGADLRLARTVETQVREAAGRGTAVLVASHDMAFLGRIASRLVVMEAGRVIADAPIRDVFTDGPLLAVAGLEPPGVTRVALAVGGPSRPGWPPVSPAEAVRLLAVTAAEGGA